MNQKLSSENVSSAEEMNMNILRSICELLMVVWVVLKEAQLTFYIFQSRQFYFSIENVPWMSCAKVKWSF